MTEAEAKKRWCPMARVVDFNFAGECEAIGDPEAVVLAAGQPHNRLIVSTTPADREQETDEYAHAGYACIASHCMMWRWHLRTAVSVDGQIVEMQTEQGYCGLAR